MNQSEDSGILVINPGSTTTKLAVFSLAPEPGTLKLEAETSLLVPASIDDQATSLNSQLEQRQVAIGDWLKTHDLTRGLAVIMARGGPLRPLPGGIYTVNADMLNDFRSSRYSSHASNLGALLADALAREYGLTAYIADPVTVDEFEPLARISGVPEIQRKARSHALNIKATARRAARELHLDINSSNFIVAHMGGGISVAAVQGGRIIDVNDALLGMGPFSPERAGALPLAGLLELAFNGEYSRRQLEEKLSCNSGLQAYLGSNDLKEITARIEAGDEYAKLIVDAMIYQIAKEIGAMGTVLNGNIDGLLLTGGMAGSAYLCSELGQRIKHLGESHTYPGEGELLALAEAGQQVIQNNAVAQIYTAEVTDL